MEPLVDLRGNEELTDVIAPIAEKHQLLLPHLSKLLETVDELIELGPFLLGSLIGCGGMGVVFSAKDKRTGDAVALKFLAFRDDEDADVQLAKFQREAAIIRSLEHRSIVSVRGFHSVDGFHFMEMDLFLGPNGVPVNLSDYVKSVSGDSGLLDEDEMQQIAVSLLDALQFSHSAGVVHCDLKPANILFHQVRSAEVGYWFAHLKLTDFGLAKIVGEDFVLDSVTTSLSFTSPGGEACPMDAQALQGTYDYMSPEQRFGHPATYRSDLFAVGMIILRLLTGERELGLRGRPSKFRPDISKEWDNVVLTALREDPERRYQSAMEMAEDIERITCDE